MPLTVEQLEGLERVCREEREAMRAYTTHPARGVDRVGGGFAAWDVARSRYADEMARLGHDLVAEVRRLWAERGRAVAPLTAEVKVPGPEADAIVAEFDRWKADVIAKAGFAEMAEAVFGEPSEGWAGVIGKPLAGRDGGGMVTDPAMYRVGPEPTEPAADARSEPRPVADQLRWHEPPKSTADAFAAESDADTPLEVPAK